MNLIDVNKTFRTEDDCLAYLERLRWPKGVACLKCGSLKVATLKPKDKRGDSRRIYQCLEQPCRHQFTATTGTIFHDTRLPLRKWFLAIALISDAKKGISANQLKRHLGVQYRTAWYLAHRVRKAMEESDGNPFGGTVEVDETYIGGKYDRRRKRRRYGKQPVIGMIQRGGRLRAQAIPDKTKEVLVGFVRGAASPKAVIITDENPSYALLRRDYKHLTVNHIKGVYVAGDAHTNSIENFWSLLKRGVVGTFHKVSIKYLPRYLAEFSYRFNNRKSPALFLLVLRNLLEKEQMPYKKLTAKKNTAW